MQPALIPAFTKSKSNKSENQWNHSSNHNHSEGFERSASSTQQTSHVHLMAYLLLEKQINTFMQKCKKIVSRQKRRALRRIGEYRKNIESNKNGQNASSLAQFQMLHKEIEKFPKESHNPEAQPNEIVIICAEKTRINLEKIVHILLRMKLKSVLTGWMQVKLRGCFMGESNNFTHKSSLYVIKTQQQESENMGKGNSRLSNKRKTTKCREDHKQNSHLSVAELSLENQRLRNELMQDQEQRYAFIDQLGELLDYHEKYLAQGSTTTRTKKNK